MRMHTLFLGFWWGDSGLRSFTSFLVGAGGLESLVFFSFRALVNITVNPSAEAGLLTSHSPNFGSG